MQVKKLSVLVLLLLSLSAQAVDIDVMSYNVENLFDTEHDVGKKNKDEKNDYEFLPKDHPKKKKGCHDNSNNLLSRYEECMNTDWTPEKLKLKLANLGKVILAEKTLPDILGIVEIENPKVAAMLGKEVGYTKFVMTESPDERGVDVALFYKEGEKLKFVSAKEYSLNHEDYKEDGKYMVDEDNKNKIDKAMWEILKDVNRATRNILEVVFEVKGKTSTYPLVAYVNHWPSQGGPAKTRVASAKFLKYLIGNVRAREKTKDASIVAFGDFNVIDKDKPHPFNDNLLVGNPVMGDVHEKYLKKEKAEEKEISKLPLGTYYYGKEDAWNVLDHFFVNGDMLTASKGLRVHLDTYRIMNKSSDFKYDFTDEFKHNDRRNEALFGKVVKGVPKRCEHNATTAEKMGYSDHFAIRMTVTDRGNKDSDE